MAETSGTAKVATAAAATSGVVTAVTTVRDALSLFEKGPSLIDGVRSGEGCGSKDENGGEELHFVVGLLRCCDLKDKMRRDVVLKDELMLRLLSRIA